MSVTDEDVDIFLAHYGVPGMKWGVRKDRSAKTAEEKSAQRKKVVKTAAVVAAAAGAAFVAYKLKQSPPAPKTFKASPSARNKQVVQELLTDAGKRKIADIQKERARVSEEVNNELKRWYNESSTPIPNRWFMEDK